MTGGTLIKTIEQLLSVCNRLILGEVGIRSKGGDNDVVRERYGEVEAGLALYRGRISAVVLWNAFEAKQSAAPGYGLFRYDGKPLGITLLPAGLQPGSMQR